MRPRTTLAIALSALLFAPPGAPAQTSQPPDLATVTTWEVAPGQIGTFLSVATKVVKAANEAKLGEAYSWTMWQNFYTITIVGSFNRKELDDPNDWMKQFEGTPGQATLMEAFQEMEAKGLQIQRATTEIHQARPDWSYQPAGMGQAAVGGVHVMEFWLKSGQQNEQQWNALMGDFGTFFKDIGYPYAIYANMVRYGEQRMLIVTAYDDLAAYHGANSVEALAKKHNAGERWQGLIGRVSQLTTRAQDSHHEFLPGQSYMGPQAQPGGQP